MTGALIVLALGFVIIYSDWHMATPRDPKTKKRKRLSPTDRMRLRQLFMATIVIAIVAYFFPTFFDD
jgi:hypothetical protein